MLLGKWFMKTMMKESITDCLFVLLRWDNRLTTVMV